MSTCAEGKIAKMTTRRETLKQGAVLASLLCASGMFPPGARAAYNKSAFEAKTLADAFKRLGLAAPAESKSVTLQAPEFAENGALVPIEAVVALGGVKQILFLVEKNPTVLIAAFTLSDYVEPSITTRTKMAESCDVYAVAVMHDRRVLYARKEVKVTMSGCG